MKIVGVLGYCCLFINAVGCSNTSEIRVRAAVTADDIKALRDALAAQSSALAAQQQQIQELKQELERRDQAWQQSQQQLQNAQATAADAQSKAAVLENVSSEEKSSVAKTLNGCGGSAG
jgi:septal ring factor EnvC (AmiA/AmiB activator)